MKKRIQVLALSIFAFCPLSAQIENQPEVVADSAVTTSEAAPEAVSAAVSDEGTSTNETKESLREKAWSKYKKYRTIAYLNESMTAGSETKIKGNGDFGISLTFGRTYYLHKEPLAGLIKFGIDATFFNINYVYYGNGFDELEKYNPEYGDEDGYANRAGMMRPLDYYDDYKDYIGDYDWKDEVNLGSHHLTVGMQVGPSITINPIDYLKASLYFRYSPTYEMLLVDEEFGSSYATYFNYGFNVSYRKFLIGIEGYWGNSKFKHNAFDYEVFNGTSNKTKFSTRGLKLYIGMRI